MDPLSSLGCRMSRVPAGRDLPGLCRAPWRRHMALVQLCTRDSSIAMRKRSSNRKQHRVRCGIASAIGMITFVDQAAASQSQECINAMSSDSAADFLSKIHWFDGLTIATAQLTALDASQFSNVLTPDRIALGVISLILSVLYLLKAQDAGSISSQLAEATSRSQAADEALRTSNKEKELLQRELSSAQEEAKDLGRSLAEASESYTRAAEALGDSQKCVQRLTSTLEGVSDAREQLEASLQSAKEREHEVTQQLATTAGSVVSLKAQAAAAAAETGALQRELQSVKQDYRVMALKLEDKIDALTEEVKGRDRQLAEAREAAAKLSAKEHQLGQQLAKTEKLLKNSQAEAANLLVELRAAEEAQGTQRETVAALEAALKEARERGAAAVAQLAAERESAATLEKARAAAVQDARELLAEIRELTFALEESNAAAQQLQTELTAAQEEAKGLVRDLEDGAADRARLQSEADAAIRVARELKSALEESNTAAEHLHTELALAQEEAAGLARDLEDAAADRTRLQSEVDAAVQDAREALGRESDIQEQLQRADQVNEDLQAKLAEAEKGALVAQSQALQLSEAEHKVLMLGDELESSKREAKSDIRRLSVELQGLRDHQAALSSQAAKMNDELAARSEAATELQEAQAAISRLNAALADAQKAANGSLARGKGRASGGKAKAQAAPVDQVITSPEPIDGEALAAAAMVSAANRRAIEVRAEAAMLVEAVEDRAASVVQEAQEEAARHAAEVERLKQELARTAAEQ